MYHVLIHTHWERFDSLVYELLNSVKSIAIQIGASGITLSIYDEEREKIAINNGEAGVWLCVYDVCVCGFWTSKKVNK